MSLGFRLLEPIAGTGSSPARGIERSAGTVGYALAYVAGDVDAGLAFIDQALALNPHLATAWNYSGWVRIFCGEHQSAMDCFERALRLSPRDPTVFHTRTGIAYANLLTGHYDDASAAWKRRLAWDFSSALTVPVIDGFRLFRPIPCCDPTDHKGGSDHIGGALLTSGGL